jgi:signal transduction histidine kinase
MGSSSTKTLPQQLRWQLILAGIAFGIAIIVSLTFITIRTVDFATDSILKVEAHNLLNSLEQQPNKPLPKDKGLQAYLSWENIPLNLQTPFSHLNIEYNQVYEEEYINDTGGYSYIALLFFRNNKGKSIYLLSEYSAKQTDEVMLNILENLLLDAFWLLISIFFLLFLFVFWLLKRTNESMKLLSNWAYKLKDNDHLTQEEFPIAELNVLAAQLKAGVDRITEYNMREQQFLKHASHEMRTPLATIQACLDTLDFQLIGAPQKTVQRALRASSNMNRLSSALLWLARESESPIEKSSVQLVPFCQHQIEEHQYLLKNRDIKIELRVNTDSIDIEEDVLLVIFSNLLRNACQFTGEGTITINMSAHSVSISNPIDPECEGSGSSHHRFGLGLQLVSRICEKLGWEFSFEEHSSSVKAQVAWCTTLRKT